MCTRARPTTASPRPFCDRVNNSAFVQNNGARRHDLSVPTGRQVGVRETRASLTPIPSRAHTFPVNVAAEIWFVPRDTRDSQSAPRTSTIPPVRATSTDRQVYWRTGFTSPPPPPRNWNTVVSARFRLNPISG